MSTAEVNVIRSRGNMGISFKSRTPKGQVHKAV